jgi:SAM-dependent methyltransferase
MEDRAVHRAGNALTDDFGAGVYDLVFLAAVVHHFDEAANPELMRRIARALKPGGIVAVWESARQDRAGRIRQIASLLDLFFGFFSEAGAWSRAEVAAWFRQAGLEVQKPRPPGMIPDLALHTPGNRHELEFSDLSAAIGSRGTWQRYRTLPASCLFVSA